MPDHDVFLLNGERYILLRDGQDHWAMCTDPTKRGTLVLPTDNLGAYQRVPNEVCTEQQLLAHAQTRQANADSMRASYFAQINGFTRLQLRHAIFLLEAEYISALAALESNRDATQDNTLLTSENTARTKLFYFVKRNQWIFPRFGELQDAYYRYSLQDNFVGETAHIKGCAALYNNQVRYRCVTHPPHGRFTAFMAQLPTYDNLEADAKTDINETLLAPRTIDNPVDAHQTIYRSFVEQLTDQRKQEIVQWAGGRVQAHPNGANVFRVGVWIRQVPQQDGHTADQNMSQTRFQLILQAAAAAGVDEVIVLGDGWPGGQQTWLNNTVYALAPGNNQRRAYTDFVQMWTSNQPGRGIPDLQHADPVHARGYAEQALVYSVLYRNPDANTHVNMACIITNKSGGPDLPSLAGVPQIQIAEMAAGEVFVHHRMGFQSLCSPMWTVLRAQQRGADDVMTLSNPQVQELTTLIQRARQVRNWHMTGLTAKNERYDW